MCGDVRRTHSPGGERKNHWARPTGRTTYPEIGRDPSWWRWRTAATAAGGLSWAATRWRWGRPTLTACSYSDPRSSRGTASFRCWRVCTVTPLHTDALTFVNGHHISQPTILHVSLRTGSKHGHIEIIYVVRWGNNPVKSLLLKAHNIFILGKFLKCLRKYL